MAKKAKKKAAGKLPKRIAGVKVPKTLREPGHKLVEAMRHPLLADVVAAALVAAAAALRDNKTVRSTAAGAADRAGHAASGASTIGALLAAKAVDGVRKLATDSLNGGTASAPRRRAKRPESDERV